VIRLISPEWRVFAGGLAMLGVLGLAIIQWADLRD